MSDQDNKEIVIYIEINESLRAIAQNVSMNRNLSDIVREGLLFANLKKHLTKSNVTIDQKLVNSVSTKINTDFFIQPVNKKSKKKMIRIPKRFQYLIDGE
ncbi:MAG: hypothetical protein ACRC31_05155, partial [Cetobacterium sp.]